MTLEKITAGTNYPKHRLFLRVHLLKYFPGLILFLFLSGCLYAQNPTTPKRKGSRVFDDTTKQVYGPNTSKYYYEEDVFYNRKIIHSIDTFIRNFHRWNYVQRNNNLYQDLGNVGTAIRPIYYQAPQTIGVRTGFEAYDLYWNSEKIRYYDTKSPYSNMNVILGGRGRSLTRATFSRNISPRWNFGFTYRGFFIDKQVPQRKGKGDREVKSNYYDFYTAYHSKDSIYRIFASFQRTFHRVFEPGGVQLTRDTSYNAYYADNAVVWLSAAESNDLRTNFHFNHQIQAGQGLQVYHTIDRYKQKEKFVDLYKTDKAFYKHIEIPGDSTHDVAKYVVVRNEFGVKGNILNLFYNGYYAIRHFNMTYTNWLQDSLRVPARGDENYVGGRMELRLDSIGVVNGWVEANKDGNLRIEGNIVSKWFDGSIKQLNYKPSFAQQAYLGAHNKWNNVFANVQSSEIKGNIYYRSKVLLVSPGFSFTRLHNYVFFNQNNTGAKNDATQLEIPVQSKGDQVFVSPEFKVAATFFKHFTISNQTIYTKFIQNADNAIRVPQLFVNTQVSYANIHYHGNLDMHAGIDVHWRSAYYAPGYDPATRQFYNQDKIETKAFPIVDLFLNAKVKRGRILLKYNNLLQAFTKTGYFATPFYPGQRNIIDFGFDWSFYD
jgi:hypothetical protein